MELEKNSPMPFEDSRGKSAHNITMEIQPAGPRESGRSPSAEMRFEAPGAKKAQTHMGQAQSDV